MDELKTLCKELRHFLIHSVAETGGHLSSNLGVIELTVALHYVFDTPTDKIVYDVGHQCYAHKLLTGRRGLFSTLRKAGGLSGFPKSAESEYDTFDAGHASTAISAALGLACARDLANDRHSVVAVVGDGALTGGMAYEALNHAGQNQDRNFICILNDNGMSIAASVGALSGHLSSVRTKSSYIRAKKGFKSFLGKIPLIGRGLESGITKVKIAVKRLLVGGGIFTGLGFNYIGPLNGHDLPSLIRVLSRIRKMRGPILLHVQTVKGKGYENAENAPAVYHGVGSFDVEKGTEADTGASSDFSDITGRTICTLAAKNEKIVAITAAMPDGTGLAEFSKIYPTRFFDVGIAEAHAVTFAAGMSKQGYIPIFAVYSTFLQRGYDQVIHDVCLTNSHVIFAVDRAGVVGPDGETHQGMFDLPFLLHIPNITIACPRDGQELTEMLALAVNTPGPWAVRYPKAHTTDTTYADGNMNPVELGKAECMIPGNIMFSPDIAVVALGTMSQTAHAACKMLEADGMHPVLYNARFAKPIDAEMLVDLTKFKYVFTIEDAAIAGGFGQAVLATLSSLTPAAIPTIINLGLPDKFIPQGTRAEILAQYQLDTRGIYDIIKGITIKEENEGQK